MGISVHTADIPVIQDILPMFKKLLDGKLNSVSHPLSFLFNLFIITPFFYQYYQLDIQKLLKIITLYFLSKVIFYNIDIPTKTPAPIVIIPTIIIHIIFLSSPSI